MVIPFRMVCPGDNRIPELTKPHSSETAAPPAWYRNPSLTWHLGVATWLVPMLVIGVMVAIGPLQRTLFPVYAEASANWWALRDLYQESSGFFYLPHFAILFTPFEQLPIPAGDLLWRFVTAALLAGGLWRLARELFQEQAPQAFLWASLLAMPLCLATLRNGQANAIFAAFTLQAIACLPRQQWWLATLFMSLALAAKPLGIVLVLLGPAVYRKLTLRLALSLLLLVVTPFLFGPTDYVIAQYQGILSKLQVSAGVTEHRFSDINGILRTVGAELPAPIATLVRLAAGAATLGLWHRGARRLHEPLRALWLLTLTASYLMLFNPMTETNSYVILAPALGLWACQTLRDEQTRNLGWWLVFTCLSMGLLPEPLRPLFGSSFGLFWHPLLTAVFIILLSRRLLLGRKPFDQAPGIATR